MDGATASTRSSAEHISHGGSGTETETETETETALSKLQLLPWLHLHEAVVKVVAAGGDRDDDLLAGSVTTAAAKKKAGKKRRWTARQAAGLARGVKALLSEVAEMISTKFERSIPAAKFGHVAYIR